MTLRRPDDYLSRERVEIDDLVRRYARRTAARCEARYNMLNPDVYLRAQERQRALVSMLTQHAHAPLDQLRVLEIGCGTGMNLLELIGLGFSPENLTGNELLPERAALARRNLPAACRILEGNAVSLKLQNESFDIVYQSTVFTSILSVDVQRVLAEQMWRWLKPGGGVLWYDFMYDNPGNADVRGVSVARIKTFFPHGRVESRRVSLAPPIARYACKIRPSVYTFLNSIPWLRTHVLCWIEKGIISR